MDKNLELISCDLKIRKEYFTSCLITLRSDLIGNHTLREKSFNKLGLNNINIKDVEKAKDLMELLKVCNWETTLDNNGDIIFLKPLLKRTSEEKIMFKALSHFIVDYSRIVFTYKESFTNVKIILEFKDKTLEIIKQPISKS